MAKRVRRAVVSDGAFDAEHEAWGVQGDKDDGKASYAPTRPPSHGVTGIGQCGSAHGVRGRPQG